jgi:hypothetical protein
MSRLPHFLDNRITDGGEVVSLASFETIKNVARGWWDRWTQYHRDVLFYFTWFCFNLHRLISSSFLISLSSVTRLHWPRSVHVSCTDCTRFKWMPYVFI